MHQFDHPIDHEHAHTLLRPTKAPHSRVPLAPCRGRRRNSAQRLEGGCFDGVQYLASWGPCIRLIWGRQASVKDRKRVVGGWLGKRYDEASDSRRYGSCGVVFALPDPPHLLSPPRARRTDRYTSQWHVTSTPDSLKQPYAALHRRTTMDADRGCARVAVLTSRRFGAVVASETRFEHVTAPKHRGIHWVFRYGPGGEVLQHVPSPTSAARATLAPASSPRARRARHESPLQPRAPQPPARHPWPWRAASVARPSVRADQRGCTDFGRKVGALPS